jgi:hypothetical protein
MHTQFLIRVYLHTLSGQKGLTQRAEQKCAKEQIHFVG